MSQPWNLRFCSSIDRNWNSSHGFPFENPCGYPSSLRRGCIRHRVSCSHHNSRGHSNMGRPTGRLSYYRECPYCCGFYHISPCHNCSNFNHQNFDDHLHNGMIFDNYGSGLNNNLLEGVAFSGNRQSNNIEHVNNIYNQSNPVAESGSTQISDNPSSVISSDDYGCQSDCRAPENIINPTGIEVQTSSNEDSSEVEIYDENVGSYEDQLRLTRQFSSLDHSDSLRVQSLMDSESDFDAIVDEVQDESESLDTIDEQLPPQTAISRVSSVLFYSSQQEKPMNRPLFDKHAESSNFSVLKQKDSSLSSLWLREQRVNEANLHPIVTSNVDNSLRRTGQESSTLALSLCLSHDKLCECATEENSSVKHVSVIHYAGLSEKHSPSTNINCSENLRRHSSAANNNELSLEESNLIDCNNNSGLEEDTVCSTPVKEIDRGLFPFRGRFNFLLILKSCQKPALSLRRRNSQHICNKWDCQTSWSVRCFNVSSNHKIRSILNRLSVDLALLFPPYTHKILIDEYFIDVSYCTNTKTFCAKLESSLIYITVIANLYHFMYESSISSFNIGTIFWHFACRLERKFLEYDKFGLFPHKFHDILPKLRLEREINKKNECEVTLPKQEVWADERSTSGFASEKPGQNLPVGNSCMRKRFSRPLEGSGKIKIILQKNRNSNHPSKIEASLKKVTDINIGMYVVKPISTKKAQYAVKLNKNLFRAKPTWIHSELKLYFEKLNRCDENLISTCKHGVFEINPIMNGIKNAQRDAKEQDQYRVKCIEQKESLKLRIFKVPGLGDYCAEQSAKANKKSKTKLKLDLLEDDCVEDLDDLPNKDKKNTMLLVKSVSGFENVGQEPIQIILEKLGIHGYPFLIDEELENSPKSDREGLSVTSLREPANKDAKNSEVDSRVDPMSLLCLEVAFLIRSSSAKSLSLFEVCEKLAETVGKHKQHIKQKFWCMRKNLSDLEHCSLKDMSKKCNSDEYDAVLTFLKQNVKGVGDFKNCITVRKVKGERQTLCENEANMVGMVSFDKTSYLCYDVVMSDGLSVLLLQVVKNSNHSILPELVNEFERVNLCKQEQDIDILIPEIAHKQKSLIHSSEEKTKFTSEELCTIVENTSPVYQPESVMMKLPDFHGTELENCITQDPLCDMHEKSVNVNRNKSEPSDVKEATGSDKKPFVRPRGKEKVQQSQYIEPNFCEDLQRTESYALKNVSENSLEFGCFRLSKCNSDKALNKSIPNNQEHFGSQTCTQINQMNIQENEKHGEMNSDDPDALTKFKKHNQPSSFKRSSSPLQKMRKISPQAVNESHRTVSLEEYIDRNTPKVMERVILHQKTDGTWHRPHTCTHKPRRNVNNQILPSSTLTDRDITLRKSTLNERYLAQHDLQYSYHQHKLNALLKNYEPPHISHYLSKLPRSDIHEKDQPSFPVPQYSPSFDVSQNNRKRRSSESDFSQMALINNNFKSDSFDSMTSPPNVTCRYCYRPLQMHYFKDGSYKCPKITGNSLKMYQERTLKKLSKLHPDDATIRQYTNKMQSESSIKDHNRILRIYTDPECFTKIAASTMTREDEDALERVVTEGDIFLYSPEKKRVSQDPRSRKRTMSMSHLEFNDEGKCPTLASDNSTMKYDEKCMMFLKKQEMYYSATELNPPPYDGQGECRSMPHAVKPAMERALGLETYAHANASYTADCLKANNKSTCPPKKAKRSNQLHSPG